MAIAKLSTSRSGLLGVAAALVTLCFIALAAAASRAHAAATGDSLPTSSSSLPPTLAPTGDLQPTPSSSPPTHSAAPTGDLRPNSKVPYLAKACHFLEINGSRDAFNTCKQLGKAPKTLVEACDELAKLRPQIASDALAVALTALADGRTDTALAGDLDAACALAKVYKAHTTLCEASREPLDKLPDALATACSASRATLLGNASAAVGDVAPAPSPYSPLPTLPGNASSDTVGDDDAKAGPSLPSLAKACHDLGVNGSKGIVDACKRLGRAPATLVVACDELVREPAATAGDKLAKAFTALAEGRTDAVPARDVNAACALGTVHVAHTDACKAASATLSEVPDALAAGCRAARGALLHNGSFILGDPEPVPEAPVVVVKATPVACELLHDSGYASGGPIIQAFNGASELRARTCPLSAQIVNGISLAARQGYTPAECGQLDAQCKDLQKKQGKASMPVTRDVLDEALRRLENRAKPTNMSGEALGIACALTRTPILFDVCQAATPQPPCTLAGQGQYASRCLESFRAGETTYTVPVMVDRRSELWLEGTGKAEVVTGTEGEAEVRDCCELLNNECLCKMKKDVIKVGNATVGCLNKKDLLSCK